MNQNHDSEGKFASGGGSGGMPSGGGGGARGGDGASSKAKAEFDFLGLRLRSGGLKPGERRMLEIRQNAIAKSIFDARFAAMTGMGK